MASTVVWHCWTLQSTQGKSFSRFSSQLICNSFYYPRKSPLLQGSQGALAALEVRRAGPVLVIAIRFDQELKIKPGCLAREEGV